MIDNNKNNATKVVVKVLWYSYMQRRLNETQYFTFLIN